MKETDIKKSTSHSLFKGLLPLFILAHFAHHLVNALPVPMLPMIRSEFSLDYTRSGFVISAFQLSYGIAQLPSGWLADRIGAPIVMTISICGVAVAGILIGLSQTYIMLLVFMLLMGVLGGGYHPASSPLISAMVEPQKRGRALGLHVVGGSASFFLSPIIAASIAA
ncbi:MFS transporter, partial [Chloroflexota bacterium]